MTPRMHDFKATAYSSRKLRRQGWLRETGNITEITTGEWPPRDPDVANRCKRIESYVDETQ